MQQTKLQDDDEEDQRQLKGWTRPIFQRPKKSLVTDRNPVQLCELKKTHGNAQLICACEHSKHICLGCAYSIVFLMKWRVFVSFCAIEC